MNVEKILKEAGFNLDFSMNILKAPSGKLEILTIEEFLELILFIRKNSDSFGIILEQKWRNRKSRETA